MEIYSDSDLQAYLSNLTSVRTCEMIQPGYFRLSTVQLLPNNEYLDVIVEAREKEGDYRVTDMHAAALWYKELGLPSEDIEEIAANVPFEALPQTVDSISKKAVDKIRDTQCPTQVSMLLALLSKGGVSAAVDPPKDPAGDYYVDISDENRVVVQWSPKTRMFYIGVGPAKPFQGVDEVWLDVETAADRAIHFATMRTKQVIVMRRDLKMRRGKEIAQGAHAALAFITRQIQGSDPLPRTEGNSTKSYAVSLSTESKQWVESSYRKITLQIDSEAELDALAEAAKAAGLECHVVVDSGLTEFNGVPTKTCLAIGPDFEGKINPVTGHLKPY